jgi:hypothetical protein
MRPLIFILTVLTLFGCGGESFDSALVAGPGGAPDDGGPGTGGATSTGGATAATGGTEATGGTVAATGGSPETDGAAAGGSSSTGGAPETGGLAATGGTTATGGTPGTGGSSSTGGAQGTGGATCALVTHSDGVGQTWQDCVPLGTLDSVQATKACEAWCAAESASGNLFCSCSAGTICVTELMMLAHVTTTPGGSSDIGLVGWSYTAPIAGTVTKVDLQNGSTCSIVGTWN